MFVEWPSQFMFNVPIYLYNIQKYHEQNGLIKYLILQNLELLSTKFNNSEGTELKNNI